MNKFALNEAVQACKENTREALQLVYDSIESKGQQKKLLKNEKVKALFDLYEVNCNEE